MSSKILGAVEYAKFKAWSTVPNRARFWGSPVTTWVRDDIHSVPRLYSTVCKLFDLIVLAWIANLQRRGV